MTVLDARVDAARRSGWSASIGDDRGVVLSVRFVERAQGDEPLKISGVLVLDEAYQLAEVVLRTVHVGDEREDLAANPGLAAGGRESPLQCRQRLGVLAFARKNAAEVPQGGREGPV